MRYRGVVPLRRVLHWWREGEEGGLLWILHRPHACTHEGGLGRLFPFLPLSVQWQIVARPHGGYESPIGINQISRNLVKFTPDRSRYRLSRRTIFWYLGRSIVETIIRASTRISLIRVRMASKLIWNSINILGSVTFATFDERNGVIAKITIRRLLDKE